MQKLETIIDGSWIVPTPADTDCLTCPVCYKLIGSAQNAVECSPCHKLVCMEDHRKITEVKSVCPNCKLAPWKTTPYLHPLHQALFDGLSYHCE